MASRSMGITVHNFINPPIQLIRKDMGLSHGIWSNNGGAVPPEKIDPFQTVWFGSESDGFATGTEGFVLYSSNIGDFHIGWDNPYVGSNGFGVDTPPGYGGSHTNESGNNANVEVFLYKA